MSVFKSLSTYFILSLFVITYGCNSGEETGVLSPNSPDTGPPVIVKDDIPVIPAVTPTSTPAPTEPTIIYKHVESDLDFSGIASATELTQISVILNWEKVDGAELYLLFKVDDMGPKFFRTISKNKSSIKMVNLRPEESYSYMIRALDDEGLLTSESTIVNITTPAYPEYKNQHALSFSSGKYIQLPASSSYFSSNKRFTISTWIKTATKQSGEGRILTFHREGRSGSAVNIALIGEDVSLGFRDTDGTYSNIKHRVNYYDNQWHQVTISYNNRDFRLYFDSLLVATVRSSFVGFGEIGAFVGSFDGTSHFLNGVVVDELTIWKSTLSGRTVEELYWSGEFFDARLHSKAAALMGYYRMGDGEGDLPTLINDLMGPAQAAGINLTQFTQVE